MNSDEDYKTASVTVGKSTSGKFTYTVTLIGKDNKLILMVYLIQV